VSALEEVSRDELIRLAVERDQLIAVRDAQIVAMAGELSELRKENEVLAGKLARLEHLLSRNSKNSSSPPSKDDGPGKTPPPVDTRRGGGPKRSKGKQPGAAGANLVWSGSSPRVSASSGFLRAAASVAMILLMRVIWGWSIAISSMRSPRSG
jgi:hypothetical protein